MFNEQQKQWLEAQGYSIQKKINENRISLKKTGSALDIAQQDHDLGMLFLEFVIA